MSINVLSRLLVPVSETLCCGGDDVSVTVDLLPSQNLPLQKILSPPAGSGDAARVWLLTLN